MAKYKLCPMCGTQNSPAVLECLQCGNDLMGVRITDDSIAAEAPAAQPEASGDGRLVRLCDCGAVNEVSARKCAACGEDISDIIPTPVGTRETVPGFRLASIDRQCTLQLEPAGEYTIGREHELADYLRSRLYVSRRHARVTVTAEGVFIENLSRANGTYVNNEKVPEATAYALCPGDEIGLGGFVRGNIRQDQAAYFVLENV